MLRFLPRSDINTVAWDACVAASAEGIVYGYSWYLDAVTTGEHNRGRPTASPALRRPALRWAGLVLMGYAGTYRAVLPVPLRRKWGRWVVHQPLFCQFLTVFSPDAGLDPTPFLRAVQQRYRYGSVLCLRPAAPPSAGFDAVQQRITHVLDLSVGYQTVRQHYTRDRKLNLRRAERYGWTVVDSTDPEPLLTLFRDHHADSIDGGVGDWAYVILRGLIQALRERGLASIRYAVYNDRIEAGALFVQAENRIIYLFNAASEMGRQGNARALLIDQVIRANSGMAMIFDFESPQKASVVHFYRSFGALAEPYGAVRWNRLTVVETWVQRLLMRFR